MNNGIGPDLGWYDYILVNTSAGKDSLVMLDKVCGEAREAGVIDRVIACHQDLGRVEWAGTKALAKEQADKYGVRFISVSRSRDLLHQVEHERKQWPGQGQARFCTSDQKTKEAYKVMTQLCRELNERHERVEGVKLGRRVRILYCLGLRAQESDKREVKCSTPFVLEDKAMSNPTVRLVSLWLPIADWTEDRVWATIRAKGLKYHWAYDLGMPRLSCVFCIYAPKPALLLAGYHNRALLSEYVGVEQRIGHNFKSKTLGLTQIENELKAGYVPAGRIESSAWAQCA